MIKVFSIPFDSQVAEFNDSEIRKFIENKEINSICHYFFTYEGKPYLIFVVQYQEGVPPPAFMQGNSKENIKNSNSWKKILQDSDMKFFDIFREWRAKRSQKEGVPPYILFTNNQLAQIVFKKPQSLSELSQIQGIGKAKLEKYGHEILEISKVGFENHEQ